MAMRFSAHSLARMDRPAIAFTNGSIAPALAPYLFALVVLPLTFLGCLYYPWKALGAVPWLQVFVLINPLVYMCEGFRAALTTGVPHMSLWAIYGALILALLSFGVYERAHLINEGKADVERQLAVDEDPQVVIAAERELLAGLVLELHVNLGREVVVVRVALVAEPLFLLGDAAVVARLGTAPLAGVAVGATTTVPVAVAPW